MKRILCFSLGLCLFTVSCSSPAQKAFWKGAATVGLNVTQVVADAAVKGVLAKADGTADLTAKGNLLDGAALGLRTLQNQTGGILTPDIIAGTILQFTDPTKTHWAALADNIAVTVASSPLPSDQALEQAAVGLNAAAATTR